MPADHPPLREPTYFVLASLLDGSLHGYGIIKRAHELSSGRVTIAAGTLYGALDRLMDEGLVAADGEETVDGRLRRYYRLTGEGQTVVAAEATRLRQASDVVTSRLRPATLKERPA
jgi:PadR family transcriptional regulator, regulatory protein PadR